MAIIACGITLDEAVKAAERLAEGGVHARVLDAYSIKPIDAEAVRAAARDCGAIVTVEDHWPEGGLGDAVLEALAEATTTPTWSSSPCARCRPPARPRSCCTARASTRTRSPTPPEAGGRSGVGTASRARRSRQARRRALVSRCAWARLTRLAALCLWGSEDRLTPVCPPLAGVFGGAARGATSRLRETGRGEHAHPLARCTPRPRGHIPRVRSIVQFSTHVAPSSNENDWSQRAESPVISDQSKRMRIGMPSRTSAVSKRAVPSADEASLDRWVQAAWAGRGGPPDAPHVALRVVQAQGEALVAGGVEVVEVADAAEHRLGVARSPRTPPTRRRRGPAC